MGDRGGFDDEASGARLDSFTMFIATRVAKVAKLRQDLAE
jgi:hypothetical protein